MPKNQRKARGMQIQTRQNVITRQRRKDIAVVLKKVNDEAFFCGSNIHQLNGMSWERHINYLPRATDRRIALDGMVGLLSERKTWEIILFLGVNVGDQIEVFTVSARLKDVNYLTVGKDAQAFIDTVLAETKHKCDQSEVYQETQLDPTCTIAGYGYYLFNDIGYDVDRFEDQIADTLNEEGVFDANVPESEYIRIEPDHIKLHIQRVREAIA